MVYHKPLRAEGARMNLPDDLVFYIVDPFSTTCDIWNLSQCSKCAKESVQHAMTKRKADLLVHQKEMIAKMVKYAASVKPDGYTQTYM